MTAALLTILVLFSASASGAKGATRSVEARYAQAQSEFNRGNFGPALKLLDSAALDTSEDEILGKIHLLRGQIFAAEQQEDDEEAAFALALDHDPEVSLDPARVDPKQVRTLNAIRDRTKGELVVRTDVPAKVTVDGRAVGQGPATVTVSIGRHEVGAVSLDGQHKGRTEAVVRARKTTEARVEVSEGEGAAPIAARPMRGALVDLRTNWYPPAPGESIIDPLGLELGGAYEEQYWRLSLHLRLYSRFGVIPRASLHLPVTDRVAANIELELPIIAAQFFQIDVGVAVGAEYAVTPTIGVFGLLGIRQVLISAQDFDRTMFLPQAGVRFHLPL